MRIAFVLGQFPVLSETFILSQITGMLARGHRVEILAGHPGSVDTLHPDVKDYELLERTHYWPSARELAGRPGRLRAAVASAARAVAPGSPLEASDVRLASRAALASNLGEFDALISHFGHVAREAQILRDMGALSGKLVTFFHAYDLTVFLREQGGPSVYRRLFEAGDLFLPISKHWKYRLEELGAPADATHVHHMGIDSERFSFRARRPDGDTVRVISVARFVEKKGLYYALRAVAAAIEESERHIEYHLVGDGELRPQLERLVDELEIGEHVRFHGWKTHDEVANLLDRMHLMLAPSVTALNGDTEGIPMVLMEAMARGLPVLSTYHSGIPELVEDGRHGVLVPERDVDGLCEGLLWLVEHADEWESLGRAARAKVERDFDVDILNDRLEERLAAL